MTFVKQLCSFIFILTVVLYLTPLQQVLKIPVMLEHYAEHKKNKPCITFTEFLYMHYIGDDGTTADDNRDMELPFKKSNIGKSLQESYDDHTHVFLQPRSRPLPRSNYSVYVLLHFPDAHGGALLRPPIS